jgi:CHAT domain
MTKGRGAEALEELRIRFRHVGADRYFVLANGPAWAADVIDWRPRVNFVAELDELFKEAFGETPRRSATPIDVRLTELGRELFSALLPSSIRDCLEASLSIAQAENCELRVRFDLPASLSDLPVEILCPPQDDPIGLALALNGSLSVVRSVSVNRRRMPRLPKPEDDEQPLSVLVVVASPGDRQPLDVGAELDRLENELRYFAGFRGVVLDVLGGPNNDDPATLAELSNRVTRSSHPLAVLLIAHGETSPDHGQACVVLESDDRCAHPIPANRLAATLGNGRHVRFVALNLCVGARVVAREPLSGVAQALISNGIPAVVGMSTELSDEAGSRFSPPLFRALAGNETIDEAVQLARIQIDNRQADTRIEWCAPVLCVEDGCLRGRLFNVKSLGAKANPMREGLEAAKRFDTRPHLDDLAPATLFYRSMGDWKTVLQKAIIGIADATDEQHRARFAGLKNEAGIELAISHINGLCRDLASACPSEAHVRRPALRDVPAPIAACLDREIERRNELRQLHIQYTKGREAEDRGHWAAAIKAFELFAQRAYLDGRQRLAYAKGRLAEAEAEKAEKYWAHACDAYAEVGDGLPDSDVGLRRPYAQGRAAELNEDWSRTVEAYAVLPAGYRDRDQRLPYSRGRAAEQAGDWAGVCEGFGPLVDNYRDVGLRRGYASARVAENDSAWARVIELLTSLEDGFRGGDLGQLRTYAEARQAEDGNRWKRAAELYKTLGDGQRDVAIRRPYAEGRAAQADGDWAAAVKAYRSLHAGYRDVVSRRRYVSARHAETKERWKDAVRAYEAIPEHPHTAQRLPYAKACLADSMGSWKAVIEALREGSAELAEDLRTAAKLLGGYARGRLAEDANQWLVAAQAYRACGAFRDAPVRVGYVAGRDHEDSADWTEALTAYAAVADVVADADLAARRLTKLRDALPWMDSLPRRGLVEDPAAWAHHASPYQALAVAGITPSSTAQEVKDASFVLMANDLWTPDARMAWDRLRSVPERLAADAFLYRLTDGSALSRAQRDFEPRPPTELVTRLQGQVGRDAPLFSLLSGQREAAIAGWEASLQNDLSDGDVAHALALVWTWHAVELGNADRHEGAAQAWESAIAYWGRVLSDDAYWASWRSMRASCYQFAVSAVDLSRARVIVMERLSEWLAELGDRSGIDGQAEHAQHYRRLRLTLAVELAAARALADAGGFTGGAGSAAFACGPLFVRLNPGLRDQLGHLVARLDAESAEGAEPSLCLRLRCTFSELGEAIVLLEQNRPDRALEALGNVYRVMLVDLPADCGHELGAGASDCTECVEFQERNPGHAGLSHRRSRVLQDAVDLATRALLALAQAALVEGRPGMDTALQRWREAIEVAANMGASVRIKQTIVAVVLGRADVLKDEYWGQRRTGERLTEAIDLVAAARKLVGNVDEGQLAAKEAELLTVRGVWYGCWCYKYEEPSYQRGTDDLRQALTLNPESLDTRDNLAHGLVYWACSLRHRSSAGMQLRLLSEALTIVHVGLQKTPGYALFGGTLAEVLNELEQWCFDELSDEELDRRLREPATELKTDGRAKVEQLVCNADRELATHPVAGVLNLIAAVRSDPRPEIRQRLADAITMVSGRAEWSQ